MILDGGRHHIILGALMIPPTPAPHIPGHHKHLQAVYTSLTCLWIYRIRVYIARLAAWLAGWLVFLDEGLNWLSWLAGWLDGLLSGRRIVLKMSGIDTKKLAYPKPVTNHVTAHSPSSKLKHHCFIKEMSSFCFPSLPSVCPSVCPFCT